MPSRYNSISKVSAWSHTMRQWQYDRSQFQAPPMLASRYMEVNDLAAMLAANRSAGVAPEENLREHVTCTP